MASAEECREALQALTNRLGEMDPQARASYFSNRSFSCHVTDLGVTFITRITERGAEPVKEAAPDEPPADIRLTGTRHARAPSPRCQNSSSRPHYRYVSEPWAS